MKRLALIIFALLVLIVTGATWKTVNGWSQKAV